LRRYVSRFGLAGAKRAFLTARPFTAQQLNAMGLFEALVSPEDWAPTLQALLDDVLALAPVALQETKKSLCEIEAGHADEAILRERELKSSQSLDFAEGRAAFAQRRLPVFVGR
jgi:enoyl-CoA hydratase/carnithine racemase